MFDGELTGEYVTLYRLLHASRFETAPGAPPSSARIEKWRAEAIDEGARILDQQRDGVEAALVALGTGFRRHPANAAFREDADPELVKRALLRVVYRLLFWFVAEERDALHDPECDQKARARYDRYFSARHLRDLALRRHGGTHGDLWQAVTYVLDGLGNEQGRPELGLPGLGGIYDDTDTDLILHAPREADGTGSKGPHLQIANEYLLAAVRSLSRFHDKGTGRYRRVDFLHLGSEELGSIYESLLELVPRWGDDRQFLFRDPALARGDDTEDDASDTGDEDGAPRKRGKRNAGGNERKKTGSYYTPASLIDCLLDSALDPVLDAAVKRGEQAASRAASKAGTHATIDPAETVAAELLKVTVCDPACGSGHFLVAAGRRIAKRLAAVREHNPEPTETAYRHALRDVVGTCLYGVDLNPMAVELAKVSLWMEGQEPGQGPVLPRRPHQAGQRPHRRDPGPHRGRHPRGRVQGHRGRRHEVRRVAGAGQQRRARADRRAAPPRPQRRPTGPVAVRDGRHAGRAVRRHRDHLPVQRGPRGRPRTGRRDARQRPGPGPRPGRRLPPLAGLRGLPRTSASSPTPGAPPSLGSSARTPRPPSSTGSCAPSSSGAHPRCCPRPPPRSSACARSTRSSTGTWSSRTSSASTRTAPRWTRPPAGRAASPASWPTRPGTRSTSRTRSTSPSSSRPSR